MSINPIENVEIQIYISTKFKKIDIYVYVLWENGIVTTYLMFYKIERNWNKTFKRYKLTESL